MRFFNLNIRHRGYEREYGNAASYWLDTREKAAIFFGDLSLEDIRSRNQSFLGKSEGWKKQQQTEILDFCETPRPICVSIDNGHVWIYELTHAPQMSDIPAPPIQLSDPQTVDYPKYRDIKLLRKETISKTPLVLASMKVNRWMSSGTFREIKERPDTAYIGNLAAIQSMINSWIQDFAVDPLDCISSLEFETLVAKIFEEHGCFVPAYKGGFLRDIDLIVQPQQYLEIAGQVFSGQGNNLGLQLKMQVNPELLTSGYVDFAIGLNSDSVLADFQNKGLKHAERCLGRGWVRKALSQSPATLSWIEKSLEWLPLQRRRCALTA